jgi:hypothetical protein
MPQSGQAPSQPVATPGGWSISPQRSDQFPGRQIAIPQNVGRGAPLPLQQRPFILLMVGGAEMSKPQVQRPFPDHLYIDVPTVTKNIALAVFSVCILSVLAFAVTGFAAIHPFVAILGASGAAIIYLMAGIIKRSHHGLG